jgi:hypothetical protein
MKRRRVLLGTLFLPALLLSVAMPTTGSAAGLHYVAVTPSNFTTVFPGGDNKPISSYRFVDGPATAPLGRGSIELTTVDTAAKQQHLEYAQYGTRITTINWMGYSTYKHLDAMHPNPITDVAINMEIWQTGTTGYTTLVYEPYFNGVVIPNQWQHWDAFAGGTGRWWSTHDSIVPLTPRHTPVLWSAIVAANPNAKVISYGINQGSGNPLTLSNADALYIGLTTWDFWVYDFEPSRPNNGD